jgi:hypothetical protein
MAPAVEHLPSKHEALISNPILPKKEKRNRKERGKNRWSQEGQEFGHTC